MLLADPAYTVPPPGPPGPFGTLAWLRGAVSRFAEGETHARRRALAEALLADLDPADLRAAAAAMARESRAGATAAGAPPAPAAGPPAPAAAPPAPAAAPPAPAAAPPAPPAAPPAAAPPAPAAAPPAPAAASIDPPYIPVAVLGGALGAADVPAAVAATRVVAAAYHPHTDAAGADAALARLVELLPGGAQEAVAARVALLVQACEATAGLVRGDDLPVPVTRRIAPDGSVVVIDLAGHPFGAGPRRCPGEAHARALVEGVRGR